MSAAPPDTTTEGRDAQDPVKQGHEALNAAIAGFTTQLLLPRERWQHAPVPAAHLLLQAAAFLGLKHTTAAHHSTSARPQYPPNHQPLFPGASPTPSPWLPPLSPHPSCLSPHLAQHAGPRGRLHARYSRPHPFSPGLVRQHNTSLRHESCPDATPQSSPRQRGARPATQVTPTPLPALSPSPLAQHAACRETTQRGDPGDAVGSGGGSRTGWQSYSQAHIFSRPVVLQSQQIQRQ